MRSRVRTCPYAQIMNDSSSDCQLNQSKVDHCFESNEVAEFLCDVDEQVIPKIGMTINTLKEAGKFYKDYSKLDISVWIISKVVLHHSHPCYPNQAEMFKQHMQLSMSVRCAIVNNEKAKIRPSKTYQLFVAAAVNDFLMKYGVGDNKWLSELFEDRYLWILVYLNHHF
ncbi:hypothetical protein Ahy_A03g015562 isoform A [Arachis hypogaea]|uniref:Protein FAR1-RELATED SEQUENCE n=1 Tax=Arachis hypogaea TaxID=3818 RepID=A0A445E0P0_ARAHY|nr:hypothetical protein Ahy_A03g015562 isoform A [Arachis hypogaea]